MLKDPTEKQIEEGDRVAIVPPTGGITLGTVASVSPVMSFPGGPPQGIQKVRVVVMYEFTCPAHSNLPFCIVDKADSEQAKQSMAEMQKTINSIAPGKSGGNLVLN